MTENQSPLWHREFLSLYPMDSNAMVRDMDPMRLHILLCNLIILGKGS